MRKIDKIKEYFEKNENGCIHRVSEYTGNKMANDSSLIHFLMEEGLLMVASLKTSCQTCDRAHTVYCRSLKGDKEQAAEKVVLKEKRDFLSKLREENTRLKIKCEILEEMVMKYGRKNA